ncbi:GNAT family N-acetyltransferase [Actinomadura sp. 21ATH]|uniref:GNAT family N-acetyltransferase n=1 Tax=Actinomadura sp. 21ATH TaxID=1735444 RepID=UPI0035C0E492
MTSGAALRIAACRREDLDALEEHLPSPSATSYHARRFARQAAGAGTYLVAWLDGRPAGNCEVRWNGCAAPEVRAVTAGCPEVNGLHVVDALRSRGIGTALIRRAERLAARRGARLIGLGVDDHGNPRAAALYARLGYRPTVRYLDRYSYTDDAGVEHPVEDPCVFLVKDLVPDPDQDRPAPSAGGTE